MIRWGRIVLTFLSLARDIAYAVNATLSSSLSQPLQGLRAGYGPAARAIQDWRSYSTRKLIKRHKLRGKGKGKHHRRWPPKPPITNAQCPVRNCRGIPKKDLRNKPTLIQTSSSSKVDEPNEPLPIELESETPYKVYPVDDETGMSIYDVDFKPGRFTCMACDVGTCAGCDIICDVSQCLGEFYTQECWCRKDRDVKLKKPLWWFREYDSKWMTHDSVYQMFCDQDCGGGICDTHGLTCKKREEGCKPWWWCDLPPPKEDNLNPADGWGDGFSYSTSMVLAQQNTKAKHKSEIKHHESDDNDVESLNRRVQAMMSNKTLHQASETKLHGRRLRQTASTGLSAVQKSASIQRHGSSAHGRAASNTGRDFEPNDFGNLKFESGRFTCEAAALPPKVQNPDSYLWVDRGYMIFDRFSCRGSLFKYKCYCWDNFLYLQGKDPLTSEFQCDDTCNWGMCEGKTCGKGPPPPLPPPPPPKQLDAFAMETLRSNELHNADNKMDPE